MSATAFSVSSANLITAQPSTAAKLIARSSNSADAANLSLTGLVSAVSTTETIALLGQREVATAALFSSLTQAKLSAAQTGTVSVYQAGTAGTGFVRLESNPADGTTVTFGLTGFTQAYRFKNTTASAFDVKIGATATDTALNLRKAINADGLGDGTDYHAGTTANPFLSATVSGTFLTLTDRVAIARQLAWSFAQSASHLSLPSTLSGAVTGALLATFTPGTTQLWNSFSFSSEDLVTLTLPALVVPTTDAVNVGGGQVTLRFKTADVASAIALKYQTSTDGSNWADGVTAITSLDNNTVLAPLYVYPTEKNIEYIRLVFTANANTTDSAVDARVIY